MVSGIVMSLLFDMTMEQGSVMNRGQMQSAVRGATELLQQELTQAGRVAIPGDTTTLTNVIVPTPGTPVAALVASTTGMFNGMVLMIGSGMNFEIVAISNVGATGFSADFQRGHLAGEVIRPAGAFPTGVISDMMPDEVTVDPNGSNANLLKMYGDINDDGNMVYMEYACTQAADGSGRLTRRMMPFTTLPAAKPNFPPVTLVRNVLPNADGAACFSYQSDGLLGNSYVQNVAVTITVQTERPDPRTRDYNIDRTRMKKSLLNVSPRNVYQAWWAATQNRNQYVQPTPQSVTDLLP